MFKLSQRPVIKLGLAGLRIYIVRDWGLLVACALPRWTLVGGRGRPANPKLCHFGCSQLHCDPKES